jgi:hypothetical protein
VQGLATKPGVLHAVDDSKALIQDPALHADKASNYSSAVVKIRLL